MNPIRLRSWFLVLVLAAPALMFGNTLSGNFSMDDDVVLIPFSVASTSTVTIQTTSFAVGGFEPVLALYDGSGNLLLLDSTGGTVPSNCGSRAIDPVSGFCLDAFIQGSLNPDNYTIALTEWDNIPNGPTLADGFPQTGNGNFTGPEFLGSPGSFILFDGTQRGSNWALDVNGVPSVPEPGTAALVMFGLVGRRFMRRKASRKN